MLKNDNNDKILTRLSKLFVLIQYKLNFKLKNFSDCLLSTDPLRDDIKTDLFKIVRLRVERTIVNIEKNSKKQYNGKLILFFLIQNTTEKFLTKYYGYPIKLNPNLLHKSIFIKNKLQD